MVGPRKKWREEVVTEVERRLTQIHPWNKFENDKEVDHEKFLRRLAEQIVAQLGIRGGRGIGSSKSERSGPPAHPRKELAQRLCAALGFNCRLSPRRRRRSPR
jgi:hypothetical protein